MKYLPKNSLLLFFSFLLLSFTSSFSVAEQREALTNIKVIKQDLVAMADSIITQLIHNNCDTVYSNIKTIEAERFFNSLLLSRAANANIALFVSDNGTSKKPYLDFSNSILVKYANDENDNDSLLRYIDCDLSATLLLKDNRILPLNFDIETNIDKISREDAVLYNESTYKFAKAKIPEPPSSFWKDIVQPVAVVSAAVITVVLLFTMRSN